MLTESIGGKCPVCGYQKMLLRYGSPYYYKYDACPNCSFAFAHNDCDIVDKGKAVWEAIFDALGNELERCGHARDLKGIKAWIEGMGDLDRYDDIDTTVWCYECHQLQDAEYFLLPMKEVEKITNVQKRQ